MSTNYRLVVLDIDGTILTSKQELSSRVRSVIKAIRQQGIYVTLATGRRPTAALPWAKALDIDIPIIAHNGGVILHPHDGRVLFSKGIELTLAKKLQQELVQARIPHLVYRGEDAGNIGMLARDFLQTKAQFLADIDDQVFVADTVEFGQAVVKFAVLDTLTHIQPRLARWFQVYGDGAALTVYSSPLYLGVDFVASQCSKASGVSVVLKELELDFSQVVAIGDDVNDRELIMQAGFGVAMLNASETVKKEADYVTTETNDEDGVAQVLEDIFL